MQDEDTIVPGQITISSFYGANFKNRVRLNFKGCWAPSEEEHTLSPTSWVNIDLLSVQNIAGIVNQGCASREWWTTTLYVQYVVPGSGLVYVQDEQGSNKVTINIICNTTWLDLNEERSYINGPQGITTGCILPIGYSVLLP